MIILVVFYPAADSRGDLIEERVDFAIPIIPEKNIYYFDWTQLIFNLKKTNPPKTT